MCGIAGIFSLSHRSKPATAEEDVQRMLGMIAHRGPDDLRYWSDDQIALATARLSVIDLAHGQQPMSDPEGRYWIAYNGEIYNYIELREELKRRGHAFRTDCDTEVALRAWMEWGEDAPARFDGGFAMAIYDAVAKTCVLIRDPAGKRPLFYVRTKDVLAFASEMKCFLKLPGFEFAWDMEQLNSIATAWTPVGTQSGFQQIKQVPSGSIVTATGDREICKSYSRFSLLGASHIEPADAILQVRALLDDSVRKRLRSDVEVALFLSGGLDSAIVAKVARELSPRIRTYSVQFDDQDFDERADQNIVAKYLELENRTITVGPREIAGAFESALWHAEVPQFRTAFVPMYLLAQRVKADSIKVVLSGEGADEIFLGYDIFKETALRANWNTLNTEERRARIGGLYPYLKHFSPENLSVFAGLFGRTSGGADKSLFSHQIRFENSGLARRLLAQQCEPFAELNRLIADVPGFAEQSPVRRAQWLEFQSLLQGYLLSTQSDRMLFAHGVEPRCPFLSGPIVNYAAKLPEQSLLSADMREKDILKRAFGDDLPSRMITKPKWPYRAPDTASFFDVTPGESRLTPWVRDTLSAERLQSAPVDPQIATRFIAKLERTPADQISPRDNQAFLFLLSTVVLNEQFVRKTGVKQQSAAVQPVVRRVDNAAVTPL